MRKGSVLVAASFEKGRGSGHLVRSAALVSALNGAGLPAFLLVKGDRTPDEACAVAGKNIRGFLISESGLAGLAESEGRKWAFVVCDRFKTPEEEFRELRKLAPVIGIDEGGPARNHFDFLFDLLLSGTGRRPPNLLKLNLLTLPENRKSVPFATGNAGDAGADAGGEGCAAPRPKIRVLVSFGGEDRKQLGAAAVEILRNMVSLEITLVRGALNSPSGTLNTGTGSALNAGDALIIRPPDPGLREEFCRFDLLVTHYGLGAFESIYAGTPVILLSPTALHKKAAKAAGFLCFDKRGLEKAAGKAVNAEGFREYFLNPAVRKSREVRDKYDLNDRQTETLADYLAKLELQVPAACPVCKTVRPGRVTGRFPEKTYRLCGNCRTIYMSRTAPPPFDYGEDYFFSSYKAQYGKTYLEDFPALRLLARRRLAVTESLLKKKPEGGGRPKLLDIGCAYGALLLEARERGFEPEGLDPSPGAVKYINEKTGIKALCGFFPDAAPCGKFDVITMMYVIEHFTSPDIAIGKAVSLLNEGGVFAFSTPSAAGVSARFFRKKFLEQSPDDHRTILDPRSVKKILAKYGLAVKKIMITGHHPERFPLAGRLAGKTSGLFYRLILTVSKIFAIGDTFEVYAVRQNIL